MTALPAVAINLYKSASIRVIRGQYRHAKNPPPISPKSISILPKIGTIKRCTFLTVCGFYRIITLHNQQVILSNHVAELYGVETREINQAVKNNPEKFPEGYIIELDKQEKMEVVKIFDNLGNLLYSPAPPKAFTEKGLYMLATILKSPRAVQTTIELNLAMLKFRHSVRRENVERIKQLEEELAQLRREMEQKE